MKNLLLILLLPLALSSCSWFDMPGTHGGGDQRVSGNLTKVPYSSVPGWGSDDHRYALKSFKNTCKSKMVFNGRVVPDSGRMIEKCRSIPGEGASAETARRWFENNFQAYKIADDSGKTEGLFTGYFSPTIKGSRTKTSEFSEPLMGLPKDGRNFKGVDKKTILAQGIGTTLYYAHPVDVQNLQIQGSGMLQLQDGTLVKLNFAGTNDMPFNSIGKQLMDKNIRPKDGYSASSVWTHLKTDARLAREVIDGNPRFVYFVESPEHDVIGKLGVPLSKIRSIAVDDSIYALGVPMFLDTKLYDGTKFQRLMVAQDRGEAIKGWIRADIFFGTDESAMQFASHQSYQGGMYILLPK
ncbi:MAG: MltA domain-containing protein [Rickettsiales bacterium]|nr:MltA domain-containing protein [Rickettsiales bacterium]